MKIRLRILVIVFKWCFRGWDRQFDIEKSEEGETVKSITITASIPGLQK